MYLLFIWLLCVNIKGFGSMRHHIIFLIDSYVLSYIFHAIGVEVGVRVGVRVVSYFTLIE